MINNKKILCVVTARAGSKGIIGKNSRHLCGKPLFMWSVLAGLESKYVDLTVVSSDCLKIKEEVEKYKIKHKESKLLFIKRPKKISGDLSKNEDALIHSIQYLKNKNDEEFKIVANLQPTSPCRLDGLLDKCIERYDSDCHDSLLTATKDTPFIWQLKTGTNHWEYTVDKNDRCNRKMRQQFDPGEFIYHDNGNVYVVDRNVLVKSQCRIGEFPGVYETVGMNNLQIDSKFDFELIENMLTSRGLTSPV